MSIASSHYIDDIVQSACLSNSTAKVLLFSFPLSLSVSLWECGAFGRFRSRHVRERRLIPSNSGINNFHRKPIAVCYIIKSFWKDGRFMVALRADRDRRSPTMMSFLVVRGGGGGTRSLSIFRCEMTIVRTRARRRRNEGAFPKRRNAPRLSSSVILLFFLSFFFCAVAMAKLRSVWRSMVDAITSYRSIGTRLRRKRSDDRTIWSFRPNFPTLLGWREKSCMLGIALVTLTTIVINLYESSRYFDFHDAVEGISRIRVSATKRDGERKEKKKKERKQRASSENIRQR